MTPQATHFTMGQAMAMTGVSQTKIRSLIEAGKLPATKASHEARSPWHIKMSSADELIKVIRENTDLARSAARKAGQRATRAALTTRPKRKDLQKVQAVSALKTWVTMDGEKRSLLTELASQDVEVIRALIELSREL